MQRLFCREHLLSVAAAVNAPRYVVPIGTAGAFAAPHDVNGTDEDAMDSAAIVPSLRLLG